MVAAAADSIQKGNEGMSYDQVIAAVKSNPALAAELAGSTSWADTQKILTSHGIDIPDAPPSAEQEQALAAVSGGGIPSGIYYPQ